MMIRSNPTVLMSSLVACLGLAACDDEGNQADVPTAQEYDDVAKSFGTLVAADGSGGDVSSIHDAASLSIGVVPFGLALDASGEFQGNRVGLDYTYALACSDVNGEELELCGDTTDTATVDVDWSGSIDLPPTFMAAVTRSGSWTLSGIQSGVATLDGDSTFDFDTTFMNESVSREYHFSYAAAYDGIRIEADEPHIVGGSIRYAIRASHEHSHVDAGTESRTFEIDAVLTFDAEGRATFVLDGERTYDLDLATGRVTLHVQG